MRSIAKSARRSEQPELLPLSIESRRVDAKRARRILQVARRRQDTPDVLGGVAVSPGRGFGSEGEGFLRLAIVENSQRLRQAVRQIDKCLNATEAASA